MDALLPRRHPVVGPTPPHKGSRSSGEGPAIEFGVPWGRSGAPIRERWVGTGRQPKVGSEALGGC